MTTGESESKVITPPTPQRFVRTILALAAVLAAVVVAWEGSQIVSDRSMKQLKAEHAKQIGELKAQFATTAEEKAKELAGLNQSGETLKSKITALEGQTARQKTDLDKMAASIAETEKVAVREAESLKNKMAKIEWEKEELIKRNAALAASNYDTGRQLGEAKEALQKLETRIAAERKPESPAGTRIARSAPERMAGMDQREMREAARVESPPDKEVLQAARSGDLTTLRRLLKDWRSTDFSDQNKGAHPLLLAAFNGHLAVVQFLLDKGASVNASDADGKTALILAATRGYRDMVELLLKRGANPMLSDKDGKTALYWALANGHEEIAKALRSSVK